MLIPIWKIHAREGPHDAALGTSPCFLCYCCMFFMTSRLLLLSYYRYRNIYMYIWTTKEKMQLWMEIVTGQRSWRYIYTCIYGQHKKKMQLCASSNGNCNRSTHLKFRSRASRGVSRQQVRIRKHRHVTHMEAQRNIYIYIKSKRWYMYIYIHVYIYM